jgi:nucleotide-binding universal stress UspA family protein
MVANELPSTLTANATGRPVLLVPVDLGEGSAPAITLARELAAALRADLVLVHAFHGLSVPYSELPPSLVERELAGVEGGAEKALELLASRAGAVRTVLRHGEPAEVVLAVATEVGASMIVMATHGRRGLPRLVLGSVAERVVRESPIPVVTVRLPASDG